MIALSSLEAHAGVKVNALDRRREGGVLRVQARKADRVVNLECVKPIVTY